MVEHLAVNQGVAGSSPARGANFPPSWNSPVVHGCRYNICGPTRTGGNVRLPELTIGRFTARVPIVQGGMSVRVSRSSLAAAVAEHGGIGTIGGSGIPLEELKADIRRAKEMTTGIIAVNIMFAIRDFAASVLASIEAGVDMIVTGAGFSRDVFEVGREHDVPVVSIVSSPQLARLAEKSGAAAIVLEATEAGGHLGTDETLRDLFPKAVSYTHL